jgi:hypothetical protein
VVKSEGGSVKGKGKRKGIGEGKKRRGTRVNWGEEFGRR